MLANYRYFAYFDHIFWFRYPRVLTGNLDSCNLQPASFPRRSFSLTSHNRCRRRSWAFLPNWAVLGVRPRVSVILKPFQTSFQGVIPPRHPRVAPTALPAPAVRQGARGWEPSAASGRIRRQASLSRRVPSAPRVPPRAAVAPRQARRPATDHPAHPNPPAQVAAVVPLRRIRFPRRIHRQIPQVLRRSTPPASRLIGAIPIRPMASLLIPRLRNPRPARR